MNQIKIRDFTSAKQLKPNESFIKYEYLTLANDYSGPEVFKTKKYYLNSDVW